MKVIKGDGSADFAGTNTFQDNPKEPGGDRSTVTVSSVDVAASAVSASNYLAKDVPMTANSTAKITSLVLGPGERLSLKVKHKIMSSVSLVLKMLLQQSPRDSMIPTLAVAVDHPHK